MPKKNPLTLDHLSLKSFLTRLTPPQQGQAKGGYTIGCGPHTIVVVACALTLDCQPEE